MYAARPLAPARRSRRLAVPAVPAVLVAVVALVLTACTSSSGTTPGSSSGASASAGPVATPTLTPAAAVLPFDVPAKFMAHDGTLQSATVTGHAHGTVLAGEVSADGASWVSDGLPQASAQYDVAATVKDSAGGMHSLALTLHIAAIPDANRLFYSVTPLAGWTVGVNAPVVIRFLKPVQDRAAVEAALTVTSTEPVIGSWHWINSSEIHFRPEDPWPAHTKVDVGVHLDGVRAGPSLWGTSNVDIPFSVGDVHVTTVDGVKDTFTVTNNGKVWAVWPTSLGRPQFATRSGNYIVLAKQPTRVMTSCNASITCDKNNPNFYDLTVNWDVRLSWSGTFVHSAPWSIKAQGVDNVSHGCINLSPARAESYFGFARYGDIVTVKGTSRGPADLVSGGDPGMDDWNVPWSTYTAASALNGEITTGLLTS
jgi:lipoprotein-anchoring transpeptidase ErfK/SrfK